ncbi:unnamed protein product [Caenorhabditis angaria]|uniref:Uncharacterized protein n=1 Tax=Caenorhabditis angaria TaxID=860376 RepID=A0A9P1IGT9_9PELO|nr:unnamed protein product [Caenorhabditis angaria]
MKTKGSKDGSSNSNESVSQSMRPIGAKKTNASPKKRKPEDRKTTQKRGIGTPKKEAASKNQKNKKNESARRAAKKPEKKLELTLTNTSNTLIGSEEPMNQQGGKNNKKKVKSEEMVNKLYRKKSVEVGKQEEKEKQAAPKKKKSEDIKKEESVRNNKNNVNQIAVTKQYFKDIVESRKVLKTAESLKTEDRLPEKLKELKRKENQEKTARIKKEFSATDEKFEESEKDKKLFDENGNPFWATLKFDAKEVEKEGVEVEGRITSEHVIKYLEGALMLQQPPKKPTSLDWTRSLAEMEDLDDEHFNDDVIMYYSLNNIIKNSERALKRCTSNNADSHRVKLNDSKVLCSPIGKIDKEVGVIIQFKEKIGPISYERENPIESIRKQVKK